MQCSVPRYVQQRENRFLSGIGCAELPYSGSTLESGARCCCILCCPYHHCQTRRAASSMPLAQWAVHSPRAGGGHRAISLKKMSRSDTMPMFPNCYVGTGRALCAQCGISVNPHIRCRCTACGVRHWHHHGCRRVRFCPHCCETVSIFTPFMSAVTAGAAIKRTKCAGRVMQLPLPPCC